MYELGILLILLTIGYASPLRKTDPSLLTRTDPLCAQVSVGEAELNSVADGADNGIVQPSSVGPLSEYSQWKRRVLEQVLKSEKI